MNIDARVLSNYRFGMQRPSRRVQNLPQYVTAVAHLSAAANAPRVVVETTLFEAAVFVAWPERCGETVFRVLVVVGRLNIKCRSISKRVAQVLPYAEDMFRLRKGSGRWLSSWRDTSAFCHEQWEHGIAMGEFVDRFGAKYTRLGR